MKVEKVETIKNQYPKFEEVNKKSNKSKIGIITALTIAFKSRCVAADIVLGESIPIPGDMPIYLEPEYIASQYTTLGFIVMFIISMISSIIFKIKWRNYNLNQKKRVKIILGILFTITVLLILITLILRFKI